MFPIRNRTNTEDRVTMPSSENAPAPDRTPSRRSVKVGSIRWVWSTNVVCAGPNDRLIVTRGLGAAEQDAERALLEAGRMEWRDTGFRRWRVDRAPGGLVFTSHYEKLGPVKVDAAVPLARLTDAELGALLAEARRCTGGH